MKTAPMLALGILVVAAFVAWLVFKDDIIPVQSDNSDNKDPWAAACGSQPAGDIGVSQRDFELAGLNIGDVALGKINVSTKPEIVQALSATAKNAQLIEYLICVAEARGDVDKTKSEQVDYLRRMLIYFQLNPTPADFERWQEANPFPKSVGKLELPDMEELDGRKVLTFGNEYVRTIRLINIGDASISAWLEGFPSAVFYPDPDTGPWVIGPGNSRELTVVFTRAPTDHDSYQFSFRTQNQQINAEIRISIGTKVGIYRDLSNQFRSALSSAPAHLTPYEVASRMVTDKIPSLNKHVADIVTANVLLEADLPQDALTALSASEEAFKQNPSYYLALSAAFTASGNDSRAKAELDTYARLANSRAVEVARLENTGHLRDIVFDWTGVIKDIDRGRRIVNLEDGRKFKVWDPETINSLDVNSQVTVRYENWQGDDVAIGVHTMN